MIKCIECDRSIAQQVNTGNICKKCLLKQGLKFCPNCKQLLPLDDYSMNIIHNKHGHCSRCKKCRAQQGKARYRLALKKHCSDCGKDLGNILNIQLCAKCKKKHQTIRNKKRSKYYEIIEKKFETVLPCGIVVHHINSNHNDNRLENFYIFETQSAHSTHHQKLAKWAARFPFMTNDEARRTYPKLVSNLEKFLKNKNKMKVHTY